MVHFLLGRDLKTMGNVVCRIVRPPRVSFLPFLKEAVLSSKWSELKSDGQSFLVNRGKEAFSRPFQ